MKTIRIIYWSLTGFIALFTTSGLFFMHIPRATEGSKHLGIPLWFHAEITVGKCIGSLLLVLPFIPQRVKEWAYVALGIDMLSAVIGLVSVGGLSLKSFSPFLAFGILLCSYICYRKMTIPNIHS